ncbi:MAG: hypothetical protein P8J68_06055 [Arenicellaceae bacterium]|nr:hypothetical protein [Arenicellaceae bacterium]
MKYKAYGPLIERRLIAALSKHLGFYAQCPSDQSNSRFLLSQPPSMIIDWDQGGKE